MQYKAMDDRGKTTSGRIVAVNQADLELRLERLGLDLINFKPAKIHSLNLPGGGVKRRELISFCFHLEQLISAGVPMVDALMDLRDSVEDARLREVIAGIIESIEGGQTLSAAMSEYPQVFDNVFVNLINAGEVSGRVGDVLKNITENLKWQDEQRAQVKKLLSYPAFVGTIVISVLFFLMIYLVPKLASFIVVMGKELPTRTKILIALSDIFVNYWYLIIAVPVIAVIAVVWLVRVSPALRYLIDDLKLKIWVIGPIMKKIILARFANYFAMLYASGITVLECIRVCEGLLGNRAIAAAAQQAGREIADGASISVGFERSRLFPPLVLRMLRVGETTGALDRSLLNVSYFYDRDVRDALDRLQATISPAMSLILGILMFWIILSVLGPIFDLITTLDV